MGISVGFWGQKSHPGGWDFRFLLGSTLHPRDWDFVCFGFFPHPGGFTGWFASGWMLAKSKINLLF